jgi:curved DNA-binding protein CbpA
MSTEQAKAFKTFRDANDPGGNLAWSAKMARKAMRSNQALFDVESELELNDDERVLWRLMKVPRRYLDLENAGVLLPEKVRGVLRGLVAAEVVDVIDLGQGKPIVPVEIARLKRKVAGDEEAAPPSVPLKARVYRPDITPEQAPPPPPPPTPTPTSASQAPPPPAPESPRPSAARPASAEDQHQRDEIDRRHKAMGGQNFYAFLEVQPSAPVEGIKKAYMKLAKELHPDRVANLVVDEAQAKRADALFKRLQDAWSTLNTPEKRASYDEQLKQDPTTGSTGPGGRVRRTDEARVTCMKADHLAKTKNFPQAEAQYKAALLLDDQHTMAEVGLAWAVFLNEKRPKAERCAEAKRILTPLADNKRLADAAYKLALIARVEGLDDEADRRVQQAVLLDPRHSDAMQEHRLIERRKASKPTRSGPEGKGGASGFFSKLRR